MACRKRPAAALPGLPRIDDVRAHVDLVREITADFPDWGYKRVGARLGERLGVTLEPSDLQAVLRVQKARAVAATHRSLSIFSGNVREHVDYIQELVVSHPEMRYQSIGRKLEERLGQSLSGAHLQVVRRIMHELSEGRAAVVEPDWEVFSGDMRDHVDAIRALVVVHSGMGYVGIAKEFARHLRVKLCPAHLSVVRRIVDGISKGRAVRGAQREPENHESVTLDVRDHSATIQELMMEDPSMDYQDVAHRFEERLQVELSDAQKQGICGVMARISIQLLADDMAMPEQSELEVFSGNVREHLDYIRDLVFSNPELGYKSIGRKLQERLGQSLSTAHLQVVHRIMIQLGGSRGGG